MRVFLVLVALVAAVIATPTGDLHGQNEQRGRFTVFKVKPRTHEQSEQLLKANEAYGDHPPVFIQPLRVGQSAIVLMEHSKIDVFEKVLHDHRIKNHNKGESLVEHIAVHTHVGYDSRNPKCDCDYHRGGCMISIPPPEGFACKCVYKPLLWTCTGYSFSCDRGMHCPANCSSLECCRNGRGDCGGY